MADDDAPTLLAVCLDAEDAVALAAFWREFLDLTDHPGQGPEDGSDFIVLDGADGRPALAIQSVETLPRSTWPSHRVPAQAHLDLGVTDRPALARQAARAVELGAELLDDRSTDDADPLIVLADPAGHPFCLIAPPPA